MTKKEYLLKLLTALETDRPMAPGLKILVEASVLDDKTIEALFTIFRHAVNTVSEGDEKAKLEKWLDFLQKLQEAELESQKEDLKDIQELDNMLANM